LHAEWNELVENLAESLIGCYFFLERMKA